MRTHAFTAVGGTRAPRRESGHVALILSLGIIVAVSILSAVAVEVGIGDARRIRHTLGRHEAQAAAESALARAVLRLYRERARLCGAGPGEGMEPGRERWQRCDELAPEVPCTPGAMGERESFDASWRALGPLPNLFAADEPGDARSAAYYVARAGGAGDTAPGKATIHVIAEGRSGDGAGAARLRRSFQLWPLVARLPDAPIITGDGGAVPTGVSVQAPDGVPPQSTWNGGDVHGGLLGPHAPIPDPMHADCEALGPTSADLVRVRGDCVLAGERRIGTPEAPVVLVVESGAARLEGPVELFGILVLRARAGERSTLRQVGGPSVVHGALVADGHPDVTADELVLRYDLDVLQRLAQRPGHLGEVPGAWSDHR